MNTLAFVSRTTGFAALLACMLPACAGPAAPPAAGRLVPVTDMLSPRAAHSSSALEDGRVLVAGGCVRRGCDGGITATAEVFDAESATFSATGSMDVPRVGHRAVRLADGSVVVIGGWTPDGETASVERYDPAGGTFSAFGELLVARDGFTATLLGDGRILVTGGYAGDMRRLDSAELFDPRTRRSTPVGRMAQPRMAHTATLLADGRVAVIGGTSERGRLVASVELFDPATGRFEQAGMLGQPRHKHAAVLLGSGDVLVLGGSGPGDFREQFDGTEIYSPATGATRRGPSMVEARFKFPDAVLRFEDGRVLVAGGGHRVEVYAPDAVSARALPDALGAELFYTTLTPLPGGRALVAGGYDGDLDVVGSAWLYDATAVAAQFPSPP